ncbi:MAG: hypothetical protein KIG22_00930 [Oxalobacter sp.]|nr:hypothetical protein [Oxalobacter paeniformigenes]MBS7404501.1 hypothetical protein [Oxalobacter sp.]MCZ4053549.1 hypothetical protein [Oxalobacter paeniformigenes]
MTKSVTFVTGACDKLKVWDNTGWNIRKMAIGNTGHASGIPCNGFDHE